MADLSKLMSNGGLTCTDSNDKIYVTKVIIDQEQRYKVVKEDVDKEEVGAAPHIPRECWAKLTSLNRATVRKEIEIMNETLQIGRVPDNDIVIQDKRLSGKHCKIVRRIDGEGKMTVHIEDSSSNGTFLNKRQVRQSYLVD